MVYGEKATVMIYLSLVIVLTNYFYCVVLEPTGREFTESSLNNLMIINRHLCSTSGTGH